MKRVAILVVAVCAGIVGLTAFNGLRADRPAYPAVNGSNQSVEPNWTTEQEWIVADVLAAIQNMAAYARGARVSSSSSIRVRQIETAGNGAIARFDASSPPELRDVVDVRPRAGACGASGRPRPLRPGG
jgi:hypothetical protein